MKHYRTKLVLRDATAPDFRGRITLPAEAESAQEALEVAQAFAVREGHLIGDRYVAESEAQAYTPT